MTIYRIQRNIPEVFEVEADSYDSAVQKIANGEITDSESMSDTYELVESWCSTCKAVNCVCPYERNNSSELVTTDQ